MTKNETGEPVAWQVKQSFTDGATGWAFCTPDFAKENEGQPGLEFRALGVLASLPQPKTDPEEPAGTITDDQIEAAILKFARENGNSHRLTFDSGPYEITKSTRWACDFAHAVLALSQQAPATDAAVTRPHRGSPTASSPADSTLAQRLPE